jgi:nucleoside-diphosphate-sugar epimerase
VAHFLITGGAGFIGSHLAEKLNESGHKITILDNLSSGHRRNIESLLGPNVQFVEGDIRDRDLVYRLMADCDGAFHLAALVSVPQSISHPDDSFTINLQGTLNLFEASRGQKQQKIVFASSAAIYGDVQQQPIKEECRDIPLSPYGLHKWMCEEQAKLYFQLYAVRSVGLRFFNVFGPRQDPSSPYSGVISIFIDRILKRQPATIYGDSTQNRDFVYVGDVVQALIKSMNCTNSEFKAYNVGQGSSITVSSLWETLCGIAEVELVPNHGPARSGEIHTSLADISAIGRDLGYKPETNLEEGLKRVLHY